MSLKIEKKNEGTKDTVFLTGRLQQLHLNWILLPRKS